MVTDYLMNAMLITMLVVTGVLAIYVASITIKRIVEHIKWKQHERKWEREAIHRSINNLDSELISMHKLVSELNIKVTKLEEKKKNVKKK